MKNEVGFRSEKMIHILRALLWPILKLVFRIEVSGEENLKQGASLLIANHNSGALIESHSLLFLASGAKLPVYGLNHKALFRIPLVGAYFRKIGAVTASKEAASQVLNRQSPLLIFPGGNRQALRPLSQANKNSFEWAKGWAEIAVEHQVPVVPIKFVGTHKINPILLSSKILAKVLILPWLFGVTYFPVSLAQFILSAAVGFGGFLLGLPGLGVLLLSYLVFCFTPLVPVFPAKVRIKIYPPLKPKVDYQTSHDLIEKMKSFMDLQDVPSGNNRKYRLNGLERFMLANEHDRVSYNSQFVFEFEGSVSKEKILETTNRWISAFPHVRSVVERRILWDQRYIYDQAWFTARDIVQFEDQISQDSMDRFSGKSFRLAFEPAVRFLVQQEGGRARLVFSCHHSLFDGAGQAFAFELWSKIYNGSEVPDQVGVNLFRYRFIRKKLGIKKSILLLWQNFSLKPPRKMPQIGSLQDFKDEGNRLVTSVTMDVAGDNYQFLRKNFLAKSALMLDQVLAERGNKEDPFIIYAPAGLRWAMKAHSTFQNAVVSQTFFFKRNLNRDDLEKRIEKKSKGDILLENSRFLFGTLPLSAIVPSRKLAQKFQDFDRIDSPVTCSLLAVQAMIPKSFPIPKDWQGLRISARGTLMRSPCLGLILTGQRGLETLTIEFLPSMVSQETVQRVIRALADG